jgi:hypothetical protein
VTARRDASVHFGYTDARQRERGRDLLEGASTGRGDAMRRRQPRPSPQERRRGATREKCAFSPGSPGDSARRIIVADCVESATAGIPLGTASG